MSNALTQEGRLTAAAQVLTLACAGEAGAMIQVADTFTGTVAFVATADGQNFVPIAGTPIGGGTGATTATAGGIWTFSVGGLLALRVSATALSAGAARVTMRAVDASGGGGGGGGGTALLPTAALGQMIISQGVGVQPIFTPGTPFINIDGILVTGGFRTAGSGAEIWAPGGKMLTTQYAFQDQLYASVAGGADLGNIITIRDSTTNVWGANITVGGGTFSVLARWNGTNWTVVGK